MCINIDFGYICNCDGGWKMNDCSKRDYCYEDLCIYGNCMDFFDIF